MTKRDEISGNGRFDFYGGHYGRLHGELAAEVRREVYGEDLGQTGWRTAPSRLRSPAIFVSDRTAVCSTSPAVLAARRSRVESTPALCSPEGVAAGRATRMRRRAR
jgi:hypothetical protein